MTACFKLIRALRQQPPLDPEIHCTPCVYFSKNLDKTEYPDATGERDRCGLGFLPGDDGCSEMRTDNCSMRKAK